MKVLIEIKLRDKLCNIANVKLVMLVADLIYKSREAPYLVV